MASIESSTAPPPASHLDQQSVARFRLRHPRLLQARVGVTTPRMWSLIPWKVPEAQFQATWAGTLAAIGAGSAAIGNAQLVRGRLERRRMEDMG